jgi:DNA-binding response OmpR family regulator
MAIPEWNSLSEPAGSYFMRLADAEVEWLSSLSPSGKAQPTKIIVASGRDYAVDRASALEAGADEFRWPITWEVLQKSIDRLLTDPQRPRATASLRNSVRRRRG